MSKFYLTTPIYYPNARPHVGSAYTTIVCDAIARYKRMCGYDVAFLTGTDEHGEKLQRAADAAGMQPGDFVAEKRQLFTGLWQSLGLRVCEYPYVHCKPEPGVLRFVYTDHPDHKETVWRMIRRARNYNVTYCAACADYVAYGTTPSSCPACGGAVDQRPMIFKKRYEGRYCIHDEMYVSEGSDPGDCPNCGRPAELISEDNYFFRLSAFRKPLLELYDRHLKDPKLTPFVQPHYRMNEVKSFAGGDLRDISVSRRRIKWGIPWPDDPEHVVYVWYDALTSYLTGIGYAQGENGNAEFNEYWNCGEVVHMIGKDILRFHAVYWPAFLMAAGLPLPKTVFAHGWIYYEQDKMSKSKGNVVYPEPIVQAFDEMGAPGNDALRYYLMRDTPFGQDGSFSYEGLIQRYNSDLANDLGNLANRTISMIHQFFAGIIPARPLLSMADPDWAMGGLYDLYQEYFGGLNFFDALISTGQHISWANKAISDAKPWELAKSSSEKDQEALRRILYQTADFLRAASVLLYPVMPAGMERIWRQLGCEEYLGKLEEQRIDQLKWGQLEPGAKVDKPEPIFPRLDKAKTLARLQELAEAERAREQAATAAPAHETVAPVTDRRQESKSTVKGAIVENQAQTSAPAAETTPPVPSAAPAAAQAALPSDQKITIDDFAKVELRVGEILSAEPIPGATKLLKLMVDIGAEVRQVCAGIAEHYKPEQLVGMKVVLVANLQPRKLRGLESNGMIVAASVGPEGKPVLATFKEDVPKGARLK